jgi:hypothetical protein
VEREEEEREELRAAEAVEAAAAQLQPTHTNRNYHSAHNDRHTYDYSVEGREWCGSRG